MPKYWAGENIFEGAMCVKIDNSFYLSQEGDQANKLYYAMETINNRDKIKIRVSTGSFRAMNGDVSFMVRIGTELLYRG